MSKRTNWPKRTVHSAYPVSVIATVLIHIGLGAGLYAAGELIEQKKREPTIEIEVLDSKPAATPKKTAPPPKPTPKPIEPPPKPPPKPLVKQAKRPEPKRRARRVAVAPKTPPTTTTETSATPPATATPAPGPPDTDEPDEPYRMPETGGTGNVNVARGRPGGRGGPGGKGKGTGGGGPPTSTGTGAAQGPVSVATIKTMPKPLADPDYNKRDYPPEAKRRRIEGQVKVRLVVDTRGRVSSQRVVKRRGYGLDQWALRLAKKLRFSAAIDTDGRKVPAVVVYTFTFVIPR